MAIDSRHYLVMVLHKLPHQLTDLINRNPLLHMHCSMSSLLLVLLNVLYGAGDVHLFPTGHPQAIQLFFVFSPAYAWRQGLVVRLLLLAAPMAAWEAFLLAAWCAFRAVMVQLRYVPYANSTEAVAYYVLYG